MHKLIVDSEKCNGCNKCLDICFVDAIGWDDKQQQPVLAYPQDCQICTCCERACTQGALEILPDWESRYCPKYLSTVGS
ncbi:MAG: 4Fe-4S binding protein [Desulfatitalea sp.]|nr:4Fe-4S binding protein [Desulfatitalea sp.]